MTKKKEPPSHYLRKNTGNHPQPDLELIRILDEVTDPRGPSSNFLHPLTTILFITVVCSVCGADDWETIVVQAGAMSEWMGTFVDLSNGIPCARTFKRVFEVLNPNEVDRVLRQIMGSVRERKDEEVVSFDGKSLRGTVSSELGLKAIHMLNAWSHDSGICLGHLKVDDKSNEIPALPQLMQLLDLQDTIVTADAIHTQKETAKAAIKAGADYVLPLKENQPTALEEVTLLFAEAFEQDFCGYDADDYQTMEKSCGRVESRCYYSLDATELPIAQEWAELKSVGMVIRERTVKGRSAREVQYYLSSCRIDGRLLAKVTRGHWGIENGLHWVLDVIFREDKLRYRQRVGAQNLASIRKIALGVLAQGKTLRVGKAGKRLVAATDPSYREKILKQFF